ncbi:MAG TPA: HAD family phosphatase [Thermoanaerobaculia bacterium]|nr:HAD family phosphatase [Thermoanaerobaculia bacterium]
MASSLLSPPTVHIHAIIFDVDGTLVDSNDLHAECWLEAFREFGKELEPDVVRNQIGKGGDLLVPDLLTAREMRRFGEAVKARRGELWKSSYMMRVQPFPYMRQCLAELSGRGIKLALGSSSEEEEVGYYTQLLGVGELLEGSTSKGDAEFSKPSPEIFRAALERVGSDPARTLAVGDTPYDILAAHRVPLPVAAVLCGGFGRELLVKAEFLFANVEELVGEIDRIDEYFSEE